MLVWSQPAPKGAAQQDIHLPSWLRCGVSHCPVWVYSTACNILGWKTILGREWVSNDKYPTKHSQAKSRILPQGFPWHLPRHWEEGIIAGILETFVSSTKYGCPATTPCSNATDFVRTGNWGLENTILPASSPLGSSREHFSGLSSPSCHSRVGTI